MDEFSNFYAVAAESNLIFGELKRLVWPAARGFLSLDEGQQNVLVPGMARNTLMAKC